MRNDILLRLPACFARNVIENDYKYLQRILAVVVTQPRKSALCIRSTEASQYITFPIFYRYLTTKCLLNMCKTTWISKNIPIFLSFSFQ